MAYFSKRSLSIDQNILKNIQALRMESKKKACKSDSEYIEVQNCSTKTPTKQLNVLLLRVLFIKEVKSLSVTFKENREAGWFETFTDLKFHMILNNFFIWFDQKQAKFINFGDPFTMNLNFIDRKVGGSNLVGIVKTS